MCDFQNIPRTNERPSQKKVQKNGRYQKSYKIMGKAVKIQEQLQNHTVGFYRLAAPIKKAYPFFGTPSCHFVLSI